MTCHEGACFDYTKGDMNVLTPFGHPIPILTSRF